MPRLSDTTVPSYREHKQSGQAIVTLSGRDFLLGPYGSKESKSEYQRRIAEWLGAGRQLAPDPSQVTIVELLAAYLRHCKSYYRNRDDGTMSREMERIKLSIPPVSRMYGRTAVADFSPVMLKAIRQQMIDGGLARITINQRIDCIRRIFRWGVSESMIPPAVLQGLEAIAGLRRGRCEARESEPVKPVAEEYVVQTLPCLSPIVADMVRLQLLTGMRSGELVAMKVSDLNTSSATWVYTPAKHKTARFGHTRLIYIGPRGQEIISRYLKTDTSAHLFSPAESRAAWLKSQHENRKTPAGYGNGPGTNRRRKPKKIPGTCYTVSSYRRAINEACIKAFEMPLELRKAPKDETPQAKAERLKKAVAWRAKHCWHPHQLRHTAATKLRREFGIEAAQHVLGHATMNATEIYAEKNNEHARKIMAQIG